MPFSEILSCFREEIWRYSFDLGASKPRRGIDPGGILVTSPFQAGQQIGEMLGRAITVSLRSGLRISPKWFATIEFIFVRSGVQMAVLEANPILDSSAAACGSGPALRVLFW